MKKEVIIPIAVVAVVVSFIIWMMGSSNVKTPAGYVGYIRQNSFFGKTEYVGLQVGPTSSGRHWLYKGQNISITPYTENEEWQGNDVVLAQDKLPMQLSAHLVWRLKADKIKDFIEHYGGLDEDTDPDKVAAECYTHFLRQSFRNVVRDEISKYAGLEINNNLVKISHDIEELYRTKMDGTPFEVMSAVIGTCVAPARVTEQIALKVAAKQELERKETELAIAQKQQAIKEAEGKATAALEVEEAKGKAAAIQAIKEALSPEYLRYEAIKGISGADRVYVPIGSSGLPLVGTLKVEE